MDQHDLAAQPRGIDRFTVDPLSLDGDGVAHGVQSPQNARVFLAAVELGKSLTIRPYHFSDSSS